ncbi:MAG TPA: hypothetical protein VMR62_17110 [Bryobacteraceae bacterium]|nr:hypothetical protein [Bryobacteraceae bacterium]
MHNVPSGAHPIVNAYRAYQPIPYDAPSCAVAAMLYAENRVFQDVGMWFPDTANVTGVGAPEEVSAVHPNDAYFKLSGSGKPRRPPADQDKKEDGTKQEEKEQEEKKDEKP